MKTKIYTSVIQLIPRSASHQIRESSIDSEIYLNRTEYFDERRTRLTYFLNLFQPPHPFWEGGSWEGGGAEGFKRNLKGFKNNLKGFNKELKRI